MSSKGSSRTTSFLLLTLTYLAFISLGLPDSVLGVAWPEIRQTFHLPIEAVGLITLTLTLLSAAASFASGTLVSRFSTGPVILISGLATGSALLLIATAPSFLVLLIAAVPLGIGAGSVDSGLNAYVAKHYSSRHMNWLHSFWGGGATLGPLVMTTALGVGVGWRGGYLWIAGIQLTVAALLFVTLPLWKRHEKDSAQESHNEGAAFGTLSARSTAGYISLLIYLLYVAAEAGVGLWANTLLLDSRRIPTAEAGVWVAAYFGSIMAGRLTMGFLVTKWGNRKSVIGGITLSLIGVGLFALPIVGAGIPAPTALVGLVFMGLGFAPIFPCLMHETPRRFTEKDAPVVIGRQVGAAYLGGALLPGLTGWVMAHTSLEVLSLVVGLAILGVLFFSLYLDRLSPVPKH